MTAQPKISFVSLGCPKALVDSERIITQLRAEGYELRARRMTAPTLVIVNTCGFLDSAKAEIARRHRRSDGRERQGHRHRLHGRRARADPRRAIRTCSRSPARSHTRASSTAVHRRRAAGARSVPRPRAAAGHQADAAPLRLSQDFRRLQQSLHLLHHPQAARRPRLAPRGRCAARGREAGQCRREGTARHLAGHDAPTASTSNMRRAAGRTARCARSSSISPASSARSAPGCGCTTSIPIRMSTRSSR